MFDTDTDNGNQSSSNDNLNNETGATDVGNNNDDALPAGKLSDISNNSTGNNDAADENDPFAAWVNEDGTFNQDIAKESWDKINQDKHSFEKQASDMRKTISKGKGFEKAEAYLGNYKAPEQFSDLMDFTDGKNPEIKTQIDRMTKNFAEKGYSEAHAHDTMNAMFEVFNDLNLIDTRTDDEIKAENDKFVQEQINQLGGANEARQIIGNITNYIDGDQSINEEQRTELKAFIDTKGAWAAKYFYNQATLMNGKQAIPVGNAGSGLTSDAELAEEYMSDNTTQARREAIMKERIAAGRLTPLRFND